MYTGWQLGSPVSGARYLTTATAHPSRKHLLLFVPSHYENPRLPERPLPHSQTAKQTQHLHPPASQHHKQKHHKGERATTRTNQQHKRPAAHTQQQQHTGASGRDVKKKKAF